jgi:hypothetical protein
MRRKSERVIRRKVHRGVMIDHEPPIMQPTDKKPPPPGDRVIKSKKGERWFIDGASGRVTKLS